MPATLNDAMEFDVDEHYELAMDEEFNGFASAGYCHSEHLLLAHECITVLQDEIRRLRRLAPDEC